MAFTVKTFDDVLADMITWIVSNSPSISDVTPGSVIRSFCEGASLSIEELYVAVYLGFRRQLDTIQSTVFDFERKTGTKATANVVFSRSAPNGEVIIPVGTRLKTPSGLRFLTTAVATILAGNINSNAVEAEAESSGTSYNVSAGTITIIEDTISGVNFVTNALAATGGVDLESMLSYKNRFQAFIEGLGRSNVAGLLAGALQVEGITSVSVVELFPPVGNVNVDLYVDDGSSGGVSLSLVQMVQSRIDGDGTSENPGYRAGGVNVVVKSPNVVTQNITVEVTVVAGVDLDQVVSDTKDALTQYVNTLGIGSSIVYFELVSSVMGVFGVEDCEFSVPLVNVTVTDTQVARVGTIIVTVA